MPGAADALASIPFLGSGLGYRVEVRDQILASRDQIDFLEIITDQYIEGSERLRDLEEICALFPVIPHGISLSIGSFIPLDWDYLRAIKKISDLTLSPYYSEHLCMTRAPGVDIGHLSPLWFTEELLERVVENVREVQDFLEKPLILENVTYLFEIPDPPMTQADFFRELVTATGCGILLDVTNVYINSMNHGFEADAFLRDMPLGHVIQLHLAGGFWEEGVLIDGHSETVQDGTWELLEKVVSSAGGVRGSILEHDKKFPEFGVLLETVKRTRHVMGWEEKLPVPV